MVYGVILASGVGRRMGIDTPKQFVDIDGKPVIVYTVCSMLSVAEIDRLLIAVSDVYVDFMSGLLQKHFTAAEVEKIDIVVGGGERIDTINNVTDNIINNHGVRRDDVVIFHDAVRPFVPKKVLQDSVAGALERGAVVAGLSAVDTMLCSADGEKVDTIPDRATIFHGQAPDSFRLEYFIELRDKLTEEQKNNLVGTSQFCGFNGVPIYLIQGDELNFKITTPEDLGRAEMIAKERNGN